MTRLKKHLLSSFISSLCDYLLCVCHNSRRKLIHIPDLTYCLINLRQGEISTETTNLKTLDIPFKLYNLVEKWRWNALECLNQLRQKSCNEQFSESEIHFQNFIIKNVSETSFNSFRKQTYLEPSVVLSHYNLECLARSLNDSNYQIEGDQHKLKQVLSC